MKSVKLSIAGIAGLLLAVVLTSFCGAQTTVTHQWKSLPFTYKPLIQTGSDNLLPTWDEKIWGVRGEVEHGVSDGRQVIILKCAKDKPTSEITVHAKAMPGVLYILTFDYKYSADAVWDYSNDNPGLCVGIGPVNASGADATDIWNRGYISDHPRNHFTKWTNYSAYVWTAPSAAGCKIELKLNAVSGSASFKNIEFRACSISASEKRQVIVRGDASYGELPRRKEPAAPAKASVYSRCADEVLFYSRPAANEIGRPLSLAGTAGEVVVRDVAVYAPKVLNGVNVAISPLKSSDGKAIGAEVDCSTVEFLPRRNNYYGQGLTWRWVSDFYRRQASGGETIKADTSALYHLKLRIPSTTAPGDYSGSVTVQAQGLQKIAVPVRVKVYPFQLAETPGKRWGIYSDSERWISMTDEQVLNELRDMKAHGADTVIGLPDALGDYGGEPVWQDNKVVCWKTGKSFDRIMGLLKEADMVGPHVVWMEWLPKALAAKLGISSDVMNRSPKEWPESLRIAFRDALRAMNTDYKGRGWTNVVFEGIDEPGYWKAGSFDKFDWQYRTAAEAGMQSYCTSSYLPSDQFGKNISNHCWYEESFDTQLRSRQIVDDMRAAGQIPWFYGTGSYNGQAGVMFLNRFGAGIFFYRSGADGAMSWTFQRPVGNAFDDFAHESMQPCITYPDPNRPGENLDTPQWEGLRQGWLDYRYAATFESAVSAAKARGAGSTQLDPIVKEFDLLLNKFPWWYQPLGVSNADCDRWRANVAALIQQAMHP